MSILYPPLCTQRVSITPWMFVKCPVHSFLFTLLSLCTHCWLRCKSPLLFWVEDCWEGHLIFRLNRCLVVESSSSFPGLLNTSCSRFHSPSFISPVYLTVYKTVPFMLFFFFSLFLPLLNRTLLKGNTSVSVLLLYQLRLFYSLNTPLGFQNPCYLRILLAVDFLLLREEQWPSQSPACALLFTIVSSHSLGRR